MAGGEGGGEGDEDGGGAPAKQVGHDCNKLLFLLLCCMKVSSKVTDGEHW